MPRRPAILISLFCLGLVLLVSPALGERGPNVLQLRQAVTQNPQDPEANYKLGMKYSEMGRTRQAAKYLKEAIRLKPDYVEAVAALQQLNFGQGNYGASAAGLEKLMKLQPKDEKLKERAARDFSQQGLTMLQEGNFKKAEAAFKDAAAAEPEATSPLNNLGVAYFQAGRPNEAATALAEAIHRDPDNAAAHFNMGVALLASGKWPATYQEILNLRRLNPEFASQLMMLYRPITTPVSGPYAK